MPHLPAYAPRQARRTDALGTDAKDIGRGVPKTTVFAMILVLSQGGSTPWRKTTATTWIRGALEASLGSFRSRADRPWVAYPVERGMSRGTVVRSRHHRQLVQVRRQPSKQVD